MVTADDIQFVGVIDTYGGSGASGYAYWTRQVVADDTERERLTEKLNSLTRATSRDATAVELAADVWAAAVGFRFVNWTNAYCAIESFQPQANMEAVG
jgi:hypothetical protein